MTSLDKWKMSFGFLLLVILGTMGIMFGMAHVEANTSFGLMPVITTLSTLAGAFAGWAFRDKRYPDEIKPDYDGKREGEQVGENHATDETVR